MFRIMLAVFLTATSVVSTASAAVVYVNKNTAAPPEGQTGASWATAWSSLQDGINTAAFSSAEVWVAQGVYDETRADADGSLVLKAGVKLYGGFNGTETARSQRNSAANETVIDGATARAGQAAYHVLKASSIVVGTIVDGFTIRGGAATNPDFTDKLVGGGLYANAVGGLLVSNCLFEGNIAARGGAVYTQVGIAGALRFEDCTFDSNRADFTGEDILNGGGAVYVFGGGPVFDRCLFKNNDGGMRGGAVCLESTTSTRFASCIFQGNWVDIADALVSPRGGAIYAWTSSDLAVLNCTFYQNSAPNGSAIMIDAGTDGELGNSILWGNTGSEQVSGSGLTIDYCDIEDQTPSGTNIQADPLFADAAAGDFHIGPSSPCWDAGTAGFGVTTDFDGVQRPMNLTTDIGAFEVRIVFAKKGALGPAHDGQTWTTAYTSLQDALNAAEAAGGADVYVAAGTYNESRPDASGALVLKSGVALYGGFDGVGVDVLARDPSANPTIIDGATARAGAAAYHVAIGASDAVLDGFTLRNGTALGTGVNAFGGGLLNQNLTGMQVNNCRFENNVATRGGGAYSYLSGVEYSNCTFTANAATPYEGGAAYTDGGTSVFTACTFTGNTAAKGGALYNSNVNGTFSQCVFDGNTAGNREGGAVYNRYGTPSFARCAFTDNNGSTYGGGVYNSEVTNASFVNCIFRGNQAMMPSGSLNPVGGGLCNDNTTSAAVVNCTFYGNSASDGGALVNLNGSSSAVTNTIAWGNPSAFQVTGSGLTLAYSNIEDLAPEGSNIQADPFFTDADNGDLHLQSDSPCRDAGTEVGAPDDDYDGRERPIGSATDMGAYETLILYVRPDAVAGTPDGLSWATAYTSLQDAVDEAARRGGAEIWVAQGTYGELRDNLSGALMLSSGVRLYGGFAVNDTQMSQRDWVTRPTTISGDTARAGSKAYHTVIAASNTRLDGFWITGGDATGDAVIPRGGGFLAKSVSDVYVENCHFSGLKASMGGAVYMEDATGALTACTLENSQAMDAPGGGLALVSSSITVSRCRIADNQAWTKGGGVYTSQAPNSVFENCLFYGNVVSGGAKLIPALSIGGGLCNNTGSTQVAVRYCTFYNNSAGSGGAIANESGASIAVSNSIVWNNPSTNPIAGFTITVENSDVEGGFTGTSNLNLDPKFVSASAANFLLAEGSPCLDIGSGPTPDTDLRGIARPQGNAPDIGAYESRTFTLSMQMIGAGEITPAAGAHSYYEGTLVPVTAVPAQYWSFSSWGGGASPADSASASVQMVSDLTVTALFTLPRGSIRVTFLPPEAVADGVQWRIDSGPWINSGVTYTNVPYGVHTLSFNTGTEWAPLSSEEIVLDVSGPLELTRTLEPANTVDVNRDGSVNVKDVQELINVILQLWQAQPRDDVNHDGKVNVLDVQLVINALLQLSR